MSKIAQFIRNLSGFRGEAALFKLSPPLIIEDNGVVIVEEYVAVSAAMLCSGPETFIFPANIDGRVTNWLELPGSLKGVLDIPAAVREIGYEYHGPAFEAPQ
jgi:hypothetical protein